MTLCWAQCLVKPNGSRALPLTTCFTCRADIDRVWTVHYRLQNLHISKGEDLLMVQSQKFVPLISRTITFDQNFIFT